MKSWYALAVMAFAVPVAALAFEDETPTVKTVMNKLHKGSTSQSKNLEKQAQASPPDWEAISKTTKDFVILGAAMAKNDPTKGDKEQWKKLANKYFDNAKGLDDAAKDQDITKLQAARKSMGASCKECHSAHREEEKH